MQMGVWRIHLHVSYWKSRKPSTRCFDSFLPMAHELLNRISWYFWETGNVCCFSGKKCKIPENKLSDWFVSSGWLSGMGNGLDSDQEEPFLERRWKYMMRKNSYKKYFVPSNNIPNIVPANTRLRLRHSENRFLSSEKQKPVAQWHD